MICLGRSELRKTGAAKVRGLGHWATCHVTLSSGCAWVWPWRQWFHHNTGLLAGLLHTLLRTSSRAVDTVVSCSDTVSTRAQ